MLTLTSFLMTFSAAAQDGESTCDDMVYYLSDHDTDDGISDIYKVTLNGGDATMDYIATSEIEVHIAYNPIDNMLYAISKHENSYRILDPLLGTWEPEITLDDDYGEITAAVFNHDGKLVIGSQTHKAIYSVNVITNVVSSYDTYAPVSGGDLAFGSDGMLYMATRSGNGLYEVWTQPTPDNLIGTLPAQVTGMAITDTDQLLISAQGQTSLKTYNSNGSDAGIDYDLILGDELYTLRDGDMASGCNTRPPLVGYCDDFTTLYVNHGPDIAGSDLYKVNFTSNGIASLTFLTNVPYEAHIAFNANEDLVYFVNVDGSFIRVYDVTMDSFMGDLTIDGSFTKLTAAVYNSIDSLLYIGDHHADEVHTVNLGTGEATYYADAPVSGGDLEMLDNGDIYLATRSGAGLYKVVEGAPAEFVGNIPPTVNGMARANDDLNSFMLANKNSTVFTQVDVMDGSTIETFPIMLNGSPFTTIDGDMAGGCADVEAPTPGIQSEAQEMKTTLLSYPNPTTGPSKVEFKTVESTHALLEVYDLSGRNVGTIFNAEVQKGQEYLIDFDGSNLSRGVYIYRLTTAHETIIEKFMITR